MVMVINCLTFKLVTKIEVDGKIIENQDEDLASGNHVLSGSLI